MGEEKYVKNGLEFGVKKVAKWEKIQQEIFGKLRGLGLSPFASREMAVKLQKLGVLPANKFCNFDGDIFVKTASDDYVIKQPKGVDFFGTAKLEILG